MPDSIASWNAGSRPAPAAHLEPQFDDVRQQREAATIGMWAFLATEVLFFGGMFLGYTVYRISYPHAFAEASRHTLIAFGAVNTAVLLISSVVMAFAVRAARQNQRILLGLLLLVTAWLGTAFPSTCCPEPAFTSRGANRSMPNYSLICIG
jgi:cytochrome c oxidase subunit III